MTVTTFKFKMLFTRGFTSLPEEIQADVSFHAMRHITPETDFIVYSSQECRTHLEDEGRTLVTYIKGLTQKCYAKLDDFGDPETWDEIYDEETVKTLREAPNCRFVLTLMLAEEY